MSGPTPCSAPDDPLDDPFFVDTPVYGGSAMARSSTGPAVLVPFALPGETVALTEQKAASSPGAPGITGLRVLKSSPERTEPCCVHFGICGGCQYQMASYPEQVRLKQLVLRNTLEGAALSLLPRVAVLPSPEPWGYRNRIRMRVRTVDGVLQLGYSTRGGEAFLPIRMCPIAAPVLWRAAEALLAASSASPGIAAWMHAASEVELLCEPAESAVAVHLLCLRSNGAPPAALAKLGEALTADGVPCTTVTASRLHAASGRAMGVLGQWGAGGLRYRVEDITFWLEPGSFFQVNRFLLPQMVRTVAADRTGELAWDLYAGAGLFSRALRQGFRSVTAVEANPVAARELRRGFPTAGGGNGEGSAVEQTTLAFLREAVLQRPRPDLVVLDPPRAGAGADACHLLLQLRPPEIVYVSCDPTTLARDAAVLTSTGVYRVADLSLLDLFPQTYHLETVMVLRRTDVTP